MPDESQRPIMVTLRREQWVGVAECLDIAMNEAIGAYARELIEEVFQDITRQTGVKVRPDEP